jgi:hypothetical protein
LLTGESEGNGPEELQRLRLPLEVAFKRMVHVSNASAHRIKRFEWTNERACGKNLNLDAPAGSTVDRLRESDRAGLQARHIFRPVGHHL